jgi:diguanylate cyclase (GGDEF)-like protein/PAS domain S-box-containing protein
MDENSRKTLFISISLTLLTMMIVYYSFYTGREIAERYIPLVDASTKVQLKTTTAHLWFEEGISGDRTIDINEVWATLDQSEWYAQAMLDGGTLKKSTFLALNDPNLRKQIEEVIKGIHHFREIAQQRWASKSTSGIGSEIDQQFDQAFLKFSLSVKNVEATLHQAIANDLKTFKFSQKILIFIIFILGLMISVLLLRYKTKNKQNIDTLKLLDKSITESQEQLQNIINGAKLGYWDWYYKTGEHRVNNEWLAILGLSRADITNTVNDWDERIHPDDKELTINIVQAHIKSGTNYVAEFRMKHADGRWVWIQGSGSVVEYDEITNEPLRLCGTHQDITNRKQAEEKLERIAHYDILTNLPNRSLLADRLSQAIVQCNRHEHSLAVVFLDLDGFKSINDAYGHDVGDELLIKVSIRMKAALRENDSIARIGGDEFVAVLSDLTKTEDCIPVLERLLKAASESITIGDLVLNVSASIGVTLYPQDSADADLLMRHADQAMYVAKAIGKNRYHFFDTAQYDAVKVQRESLEDIRYALDNNQFVLHYQPKVNMKTGKVTGVEALIRWQHPERGLLNPIEFLPIIENNPMSIELGEWVIDTALTQISQWQKMSINLTINTSVNIAALQLQQSDFTVKLTDLLAKHSDVEPHSLELEVLETSALDDVQHVSKIMNACMALGVSFALDDFGTGYSSLTYLRRLPTSLIKIDQSFVRDMLDDPDDLAIIIGVIALAKSFKLDVIAEGVETVEHGTRLLELGCELAQGYGIARPMPACDIPDWVNNWQPDGSWIPDESWKI